jgi:truncated hemoglobin YjbI
MSLNSETSTADVEQTPYEMIGGAAAVRKIVGRFYDIL